MVINDILFRTQLNYQLQANSQESTEDKLDIKEVKNIDLHHCVFADFKKAMEYVRDHNPDYSFSDFTIEAVKPAPVDFSEDKKYDFVQLTEYARHTAITIGNMTLFSELQKIASAAEQFNYNMASHEERKSANVLSFEDYNSYSVPDHIGSFQELGSCVIGGGISEPVKLTATLHGSSTKERPIVSVRAYSLSSNTYSTNRDIISLNEIYMANASIMEVFAYLSYHDYTHNMFNHSFDKLMFSGLFQIDSLEDMYSHHYNLTAFDYANQ